MSSRNARLACIPARSINKQHTHHESSRFGMTHVSSSYRGFDAGPANSIPCPSKQEHEQQAFTQFPSTSGDSSATEEPVVQSSVKQMFARLKRIAGITDKRVSAHTCRHWFAVNCIKNGMPTIALKELLGHENWKMIEVYVHLAEQGNSDLYARFSPVDGLAMHHTTKDRRERAREWRTSRKRSTKN